MVRSPDLGRTVDIARRIHHDARPRSAATAIRAEGIQPLNRPTAGCGRRQFVSRPTFATATLTRCAIEIPCGVENYSTAWIESSIAIDTKDVENRLSPLAAAFRR